MEEQTHETKESEAFSSRELSSELEHQAELVKLSRYLLSDFYQTFRLAQGEAAIQPPLFQFLAIEHQQAGHDELMAAAIQDAARYVNRLKPPARHADTSLEARQDPEVGFRAMWAEYSLALRDPNQAPNRSLELILDDMIAEDLKYQDSARPNRTARDDVHESIVREYILGNRLIGSPQLQAVRDRLRNALIAPDMGKGGDSMMEGLQTLKAKWEARHPGQTFMLETQVNQN